MLLETTYVGNVGPSPAALSPTSTRRRIALRWPAQPCRINANFYNPYKGFTSIGQNRSDSNTNYNALQVYLSKRKGALTFTVSYTFAKALGDSSSNNGDLANWQDLNYNYGELNIDRKHAFVTTVNYQLPTFQGHNMLLREAVGGFMVTGVFRAQTRPVLHHQCHCPDSWHPSRQLRPRVSDVYAQGPCCTLPGHVKQWLNPAAFTRAACEARSATPAWARSFFPACSSSTPTSRRTSTFTSGSGFRHSGGLLQRPEPHQLQLAGNHGHQRRLVRPAERSVPAAADAVRRQVHLLTRRLEMNREQAARADPPDAGSCAFCGA